MTPRTFVLTALTAVGTSLAAVIAYASANPWSQVKATGAKLAPSLTANSKIGAIVLGTGANALTLVQSGGKWGIKERAGYPAEAAPIRDLLTKLSQAQLIEAKTRNPERYALLELEDPASKDAKSKALRVLDEKGNPIADLVLGKRKWDAFGSGKGGTYVRSGKDAQTWLANADLDIATEVRRWIKPEILAHDGAKVTELTLQIPGEDKLEVERKDGKAAFKAFPAEAQKLKDANAAEALIRAAANIDAEDVRKLEAAPAAETTTVLTFKGDQGLATTLRLRKDGDRHWVSISATGEGAAKATADALTARTTGWEFKVPATKAEQLTRKRADLIEGEPAKKE
jgi:Domain of unknown function (DUF4340)